MHQSDSPYFFFIFIRGFNCFSLRVVTDKMKEKSPHHKLLKKAAGVGGFLMQQEIKKLQDYPHT